MPPKANIKIKRPISGWLVLDKPVGMTSTAAVGALRRLFHPQKIGHGGTLDPRASGILPIAMGEATKTVPYIMDATKDYSFTLIWGHETTTDDGEGTPTHHSDCRPDADMIRAILPQFRGRITQIPPQYSAIKLGGKRAYDLARASQNITMPPRQVDIHALEILSHNNTETRFTATTGKGAYIRALGRDIARALGSAGHISQLRRHRVGKFCEKNANSLDFLQNITHNPTLLETLLPLESALDDIPGLILNDSEAQRLQCGQQIEVNVKDALHLGFHHGKPLALIRVIANKGQPTRIFNLHKGDG